MVDPLALEVSDAAPFCAVQPPTLEAALLASAMQRGPRRANKHTKAKSIPRTPSTKPPGRRYPKNNSGTATDILQFLRRDESGAPGKTPGRVGAGLRTMQAAPDRTTQAGSCHRRKLRRPGRTLAAPGSCRHVGPLVRTLPASSTRGGTVGRRVCRPYAGR
jgi:hypothetical protein